MKRRTSKASAALALVMATSMIIQQARLASAAPADIFQTSAPVVGSDPPKAAEIHDGDVSVASQTGALTFSYPISVPPGRLGMQPHLALSYSSQSPIYGGVAAGWSLSIPIITQDTAKGRMADQYVKSATYKSSLAGDRPLVLTSESPLPSGVLATYRAQNDSTFQRYQRMSPPAVGYQWRVFTTDGLIHYFGETKHTNSCQNISDGYAPLTSTTDAFGNFINYYYQLGADGECRIGSITWGENANAGQVSFASISFAYTIVDGCSPPVGTPGTPSPPIGAQVSYRTGAKIVTGASQLNTITITAGTAPDHTRLITLAYDSAEASCTASHSAYRALHSIQESAWGTDSPRVDLPAQVFTYGSSSLMTTYPPESSASSPPWGIGAPTSAPYLANNLSWGYRPDAFWATVEATFVDMDGDGLLDRLASVPVTDASGHVMSCRAQWQRNTGNMTFGAVQPISLPTLKWATPIGGPNYQGGNWANANSNITTETCALNYQRTYYANGPGRATSPQVAGGSVCADQGTQGVCVNGVCSNNGADCISETPSADYTTLAYRWFDIDGDGLTDLIVSPSQGGYSLYDLQWGRGFTVAGTVPSEPAIFGTFPACPAVPFPVLPTVGKYTMCGRMYPWMIYRNQGNATFHSVPDSIKYEPIPLEPENGTSSVVSNVVSQNQGELDIDGDGFPDSVSGGGSTWAVYRNDGTGQLNPASGTTPFGWPAGTNDTLTSTQCVATASCNPINGSAGLFDVNGDGLVDQWDMVNSSLANVEYNDGASFRAPGGTGEVTLIARPSEDAFTTETAHHIAAGSGPHANNYWVDDGTRGDTNRTIDLDLDGRPDVVQGAIGSTMLTRFNQGGQFSSNPVAVGDTNALRHWMVASSVNTTWEVRGDMMDLDGDGIPEAFNMGNGTAPTAYSVAKISTTQPPRLLTRVDNGRGLHTDVAYASMNSTIVTQDPVNGKVMPRTGWVVSSLVTTETIPTIVTSTTSFHYFSPRYLADERGLYGFRGFDEVDTTLPTGATKVDRYSYSPDWSGRLWKTLIRPSEAPTEVRSIDTTTWVTKGLFCNAQNTNCAITTYHAQSVEHLTCKNGMLESSPLDLTKQCDAAHAPYTNTTTTWSACDTTKPSGTCDVTVTQKPTSQLWVPTRTLLQGGIVAANGDRRTSTTYAVWSDGATYRVRPLIATKEIQTSGTFVVYGKTGNDWNQDPGLEYSVPVTDLVWFDNTNTTCTASTATCAVTRHAYDLATGNPTARWKPMQNSANGPSATYDYDSRKLFVATEHTEPGGYYNLPERLDYTYEYGTGTKLETKGPNVAGCSGPFPYTSPTCPSGTTYLQDKRIQVDGLGRTIDRWEAYATPGADHYFLFERERHTYVDSAPASVTSQNAFDFDQNTLAIRFDQSKVDLDGHGRTIKKTVYALGAAAADQVTTYAYNGQGFLASVGAPDPTLNTGATVPYTYSFDSLGRPTGLRRPDSTTPTNQSGVNIAYDGVVATTSEFVGAALGQPSVTVTTNDSFGRLKTVAEQTATSTYATTTYSYDGNNNVIQVVDPTSVTTTMTHDFASRRTSIIRAGRTWSYGYDKNGNQVSETFPGSTAPIQPDVNYMNTTTYDNMDYPTGTSVGQRALSAADAETFGASYHRYFWELGASSVGRLADVESYALSGATVTTSQWVYDLAGNDSLTTETFSGLPSQIRQTLRYFSLAGGLTTTYYGDYPAQNRATWSNINYDNRGFPSSVWLSLSPTSTTQTIAVQARNVAGFVTSRHTDIATGPMTFIESNWTYDKLGRVASQVVQKGPGPTQVARQDLVYFGTDDPKSLDHWLGASNHKHYNYGFDLRHQITSVGETLLPNAFTAAYTYNAAGRFATANESAAALPNSDVRPRNVTYRYNGVDPEQVTSLTNVSGGATAWAYAYDPAGNQTLRCSGPIVSGSCTGTDETDYVYDGDDRLRRATRKLSGSVQGSEEYWYDGHGNRNIVVKRDASGSKTETIWFINDVEAHYDGSGTWVHSYAYVAMATPVARVDTGTSQIGAIEYQFHGLGNNTLAAVDHTTGTINASFNYAPFGEVVEATNAGGSNTGVGAHRRRLNDQFLDAISDLTYFGYRYYDKTLLGWTQADPKYRYAPDLNKSRPRHAALYTFELNNPLRYVDPDGRDTTTCNEDGDCQHDTSPSDDADAAITNEAPTPAADESKPKDGGVSHIGDAIVLTIVVGILCEPCAIAATIIAAGYASDNTEGSALFAAGCSGAACSATRVPGATEPAATPKTTEPAAAPAASAKPLTPEAVKSIASLHEEMALHEAKLADFKANPTVRPGMENQPAEVIAKQQATRIQHLETEIQTFKDNIEKVRNGELVPTPRSRK